MKISKASKAGTLGFRVDKWFAAAVQEGYDLCNGQSPDGLEATGEETRFFLLKNI